MLVEFLADNQVLTAILEVDPALSWHHKYNGWTIQLRPPQIPDPQNHDKNKMVALRLLILR
jgi:hypothetical protein